MFLHLRTFWNNLPPVNNQVNQRTFGSKISDPPKATSKRRWALPPAVSSSSCSTACGWNPWCKSCKFNILHWIRSKTKLFRKPRWTTPWSLILMSSTNKNKTSLPESRFSLCDLMFFKVKTNTSWFHWCADYCLFIQNTIVTATPSGLQRFSFTALPNEPRKVLTAQSLFHAPSPSAATSTNV